MCSSSSNTPSPSCAPTRPVATGLPCTWQRAQTFVDPAAACQCSQCHILHEGSAAASNFWQQLHLQPTIVEKFRESSIFPMWPYHRCCQNTNDVSGHRTRKLPAKQTASSLGCCAREPGTAQPVGGCAPAGANGRWKGIRAHLWTGSGPRCRSVPMRYVSPLRQPLPPPGLPFTLTAACTDVTFTAATNFLAPAYVLHSSPPDRSASDVLALMQCGSTASGKLMCIQPDIALLLCGSPAAIKSLSCICSCYTVVLNGQGMRAGAGRVAAENDGGHPAQQPGGERPSRRPYRVHGHAHRCAGRGRHFCTGRAR